MIAARRGEQSECNLASMTHNQDERDRTMRSTLGRHHAYRKPPAETTISLVNLKAELLKKKSVAQVLGAKKLLLLPFALLYVGGLLLLSRVIHVRIHPIVNDRIGHFVINTELSLLKIKENRKDSKGKTLDIGCVNSVLSVNSALEKMWKREFTFKTGEWGWLINDISKRVKSENFYQESTEKDREGRLLNFPPNLYFTNEEEASGEEFLKNNGIINPEKIVCLNVRDSAFLSQSKSFNWSKSRDWSYHDYRDSEISTYSAMAETLAETGYTMFRMGATVKEPLVSKHPRVIDYATNGMRTEFLDIYLGAKCKFCISTGSGWDSIPAIFRRPLIFVNQVPLFAPSDLVMQIIIFPKIFCDGKTHSVLKLKDLIDRDATQLLRTQEYINAGVELRDLTSDELVEAVTEMVQRVEGTFVETQEQKQMQAKLKHILSTHPKLQPSPNYFPIRAQFASCFLSRYPNFLDGLD